MDKKRIILTGAKNESIAFAERIEKLGCTVEIVPTIRIKKRPLSAASEKMIEKADSYDYLIFTSAHAVEFFVETFQNRWVKLPLKPKVVVVGPATANAASKAGFKPRIVSKRPGADALAASLKNVDGKRIFFPRSAIAAPDVVETLRGKGAILDTIPLYMTTPLPVLKSRLTKLFESKTQTIVFLSPSSVESFSKNLSGAILRKRAFGTTVIAIGPTTAKAATEAGFKHIIVVKPSTADGVIESIRRL